MNTGTDRFAFNALQVSLPLDPSGHGAVAMIVSAPMGADGSAMALQLNFLPDEYTPPPGAYGRMVESRTT